MMEPNKQSSKNLPSYLTPSQVNLFRIISEHLRLPIDKVRANVGDVQVLVEAGLLKLVIVQTPWGVEFDLEASGSMNDP